MGVDHSTQRPSAECDPRHVSTVRIASAMESGSRKKVEKKRRRKSTLTHPFSMHLPLGHGALRKLMSISIQSTNMAYCCTIIHIYSFFLFTFALMHTAAR